ncbi:proline/betaine transporter [Rickettsia sp.]
MSPRGLTTGSMQTTCSSQFYWIPWSSHGMTG